MQSPPHTPLPVQARRFVSRAFLALASVVLLGACGVRGVESESRPVGSSPGGVVLTRADISELKAFTAMDILERADTYLTIAYTREGRPARVTGRGRSTLVLSPEVLLVVDGARVNHMVQMLRSIPAESVIFMQILTGREAAVNWGSEAGNGVIVLRTSAR